MADGAQGSQKGFQIPLELTLKVIVKHLIWALGTKLRTLGKANSAINYKARSIPMNKVFLSPQKCGNKISSATSH